MRNTAARAAILFMLVGLSACGGGGASAPTAQTPAITVTQDTQYTASASAVSARPAGFVGDTLPWVYSELWSGSSPFKTAVATLKAHGASTVPHTYMDALWREGVAGNGTADSIPIYVAKSSDPVRTAFCTDFGGRCNASGVRVHVPSYVKAQQVSDAHITVIDYNSSSGPVEVDCWQAAVYGSTFKCSWAGLHTLGSEGLNQGGEGIHGGMAVTTIFTTGQELLNGHIDHALGMNTACLNGTDIYPASIERTDTSCDGSNNPPHYGNLVHLLWSSSRIASSAYSAPCKVVLTALAEYGAYLDDTGNGGLQIHVQNELSYTANPATAGQDPWPGIQSKLNAAGDGIYNHWWSCLQRLRSSDFEMLQIAR